jgi:methylphosphotriester-DNA--protein-cysteine methyltransferase
MIRGKRHSKTEISAKLVEANNLASQGKLRSEIARALGVSVMTLHRWRKRHAEPTPTSLEQNEIARFEEELGSDQRIAELQAENARLRQLLTDFLLQIVKLKEAAQGNKAPPGKTRTIR